MVDNQQIKIIDEVFMKDLREALKDTLFYDDWQIAYQFVRKFEPPLLANSAQISAQVKSELKDWIIRCKWSALPVLKDDEVVDLFKNHFEAQYNLPGAYYDLWDKLRAKLINIPFYTDRDNLRSRVKKTLLGSEGVVTSHGPFDLSGKEIRPTVRNWLANYNRTLGTSEIDSLKVNEYMIKHPVISKLPENEKERLKELFNFYEIVKISSLDPKGYEETITVDDEKLGKGIVKGGRFFKADEKEVAEMRDFIKKLEEVGAIGPKLEERIRRGEISGFTPAESLEENSAAQSRVRDQSPLAGDSDGARIPISAQSSTKILQAKYSGFLGRDLMKNVWVKEEQLKVETGKDLKALRNNFYHAINNGQKEEALGALLALAENGQIRAAFGDDERFVKFWGGYLEKNTPLSPIYIGDTSPKLGEEDVVARFENDPAGAKFLAMFFKYILEQRLKLSAEQAVMMGVIVSNLARRAGELEYQEMAYGDMETQKFRWNF